MPYPVITCPVCEGSGEVTGIYRDVTCSRCEGSGRNNTGPYAGVWDCRSCDGKGKVQDYFPEEKMTCRRCNGTGTILGDWVEPEARREDIHYWRGNCENGCAHGRILVGDEWEECPVCHGTGEKGG